MGSAAQMIPQKFTNVIFPRLLLALIIFVGSMLVVLIFGMLTYQIYFLNRVYLGVEIGGVDAGQLSRSETRQLVARQAAALLSQPLTLVTDRGTFTFSAEQLGARVDIDRTVNTAFAVGRQGNLARDVRVQLQALNQPVKITPIINFDTGPANNALLQLSQQLNQPAKNAQLLLNGTTVQVIPAETGYAVDTAANRELIRQAILTRTHNPITLITHTTEPAITVVKPAADALSAVLSAPLTLTFAERQWTLSPKTVAEWVVIGTHTPNDAPGEITVSFDEAAISKYFFDLAKEINRPAINAWFNIDENTFTLTPIIPSQTGYTLDVAASVAMLKNLWQTPDVHQLELPVVITQPAVSSEHPEQLGIKELVSTATTYFKGSSKDRMKNIEVAASKFNGVVIPPGEIFSFNRYLGEVDAENGFVESLIIQGDRTAVGIGGGVCQVSTTAFRAALFGGFEIVERWAHGYRVSWYETGSVPGLDATIFTPDVDFKFRNDTDSFILIQTKTNLRAGTITFNFYGTSPGRTVIISDPVEENRVPHGPDIYQEDPSLKPGQIKQVDWAKDGVDVTVYRTVKEGDTIIHQDTIFSRYRPWQNVFKVGPKAN